MNGDVQELSAVSGAKRSGWDSRLDRKGLSFLSVVRIYRLCAFAQLREFIGLLLTGGKPAEKREVGKDAECVYYRTRYVILHPRIECFTDSMMFKKQFSNQFFVIEKLH